MRSVLAYQTQSFKVLENCRVLSSLTYGHDDMGGSPPLHTSAVPRSITPYPGTLAELLGCNVRNLGFPGDTAAQGLRRWPPQSGRILLMYGTNEALRSSSFTAWAYRWQYRAALRRWLELYPSALIIEPPPLADTEQNERLHQITVQTADLAGSRWVLTRAALNGLIWMDGVHLIPAAYRCLAAVVARRLS